MASDLALCTWVRALVRRAGTVVDRGCPLLWARGGHELLDGAYIGSHRDVAAVVGVRSRSRRTATLRVHIPELKSTTMLSCTLLLPLKRLLRSRSNSNRLDRFDSVRSVHGSNGPSPQDIR